MTSFEWARTDTELEEICGSVRPEDIEPSISVEHYSGEHQPGGYHEAAKSIAVDLTEVTPADLGLVEVSGQPAQDYIDPAALYGLVASAESVAHVRGLKNIPPELGASLLAMSGAGK